MYVYQFKTIVFPVYLFQINIIELALLRQTPYKPVTIDIYNQPDSTK
jgi:hypothetical protein